MNLELLKFRLNQTLQANSAKRTKLATSGRLEPSRLAHYKTSKLLFSQPIPNTWKKYKCTFLLDVSWSMDWSRINTAITVLKNLINLFYWIIDFKITCFWETTLELSARKLLSIDQSSDEDIREIMLTRFGYLDLDWKRILVQKEDWYEILWNSTRLTPALKTVWDDLLSYDWERFIVLITDWDESSYSWFSVNWVDWSLYNPSTHKKLANELISKGIDILPISIWGNYLKKNYDNPIEIKSNSDIERVYEETIKFIDKNFWKPLPDYIEPVVEDYYDED